MFCLLSYDFSGGINFHLYAQIICLWLRWIWNFIYAMVRDFNHLLLMSWKKVFTKLISYWQKVKMGHYIDKRLNFNDLKQDQALGIDGLFLGSFNCFNYTFVRPFPSLNLCYTIL